MTNQHIVIVGTGFAGLGMAIRLKQAGFHDFTILEQGDEVGGTWRDNHYPGAACDIESQLYSFSFEPNPAWTSEYPPQQEILRYLIHCADKYGVRPHIRFRCAATAARYDDHSGTWEVTTSDGTSITCRSLIAACGGLSRPAIPSLAGLSSFAGKVFHSARWDHAFSLSGKRVAVIGTGASAIQIVPAIAPQVGTLHLYQRTPPWIIPKRNRRFSEAQRSRYREHPLLQKLARLLCYLRHELAGIGFVVEPKLLALLSRLVRHYIARSVPDPALRAKLTPSYTLGCKRILLSNDYYPALCRPNVELVTSAIAEVTPTGIRCADGTERALDAIILATGFAAADVVAPFPIQGRAGVQLHDTWKDGAEAYLGTTIAGFPNLFLIVGPNTGLGHSSMVYMIESQIAYIQSALAAMHKDKLSTVEVKSDVQARYNQEIHQRLGRTVWSSGCSSWYHTQSGKNTTLWPGFTFEFRRRTSQFRKDDYQLTSR